MIFGNEKFSNAVALFNLILNKKGGNYVTKQADFSGHYRP
jgi:hypothetical protein